MAYDPADEMTALSLFERAIGVGSKPDLDPADVDMFFAQAAVVDDEVTTYPAHALNAAAALAWDAKANLTADKYEMGAGSGRYLKQQQWHEQCLRRAAAYRNGSASVTPTGGQRGRIGTISITSVMNGGHP